MTTDSEINFRLDRLYAAMKATRDESLTTTRIEVVVEGGMKTVKQDFTGGASDAELSNWLHEVIERICSLRDFLDQWAVRNGKDAAKVKRTFESSDLTLLRHVWNGDKHIDPHPHLANFHRGLQLTATADQGAFYIGGRCSGDVAIVTSADVLDKRGNNLGPVQQFIERAITDVEGLCREFGIIL